MEEAGAAGSRRPAISAAVFTACLAVALGAIVAAGETAPAGSHVSVLSSGSDLVLAGAFGVVGLFVVLKRPENLVGWALVLSGIGVLGGAVLSSYARLALLARPDLGLRGGVAAAAVGSGSWTLLMAGVFLLFLTFPSGRVSSPRTGRFAVLVLAGFALIWAMISTAPDRLEGDLAAYRNTLAFVGNDWYLRAAYPVMFACLGSIAVAGVMAFRRFRRSRGVERQQFKWPIAVVSLLVLTMPFAGAFHWTATAGAVFGLELIALPVSVGVAVLRYRLYEIDRIISRTLVYGLLTVILGAAYAGLVLAGQALFSWFAGGSNLAIAISTLVVAALFLPARTRVQGLVDRRFYRSRYDARRTLEEFGSRLRDHVEIDRLQTEIQDVVRQTMQPAHVTLWLRKET